MLFPDLRELFSSRALCLYVIMLVCLGLMSVLLAKYPYKLIIFACLRDNLIL